MHIESIRIKNFKALQDVSIVKLPNYSVFVGCNGAGKTTLFRVFGFLKNCLQNNVRVALNAEGGRNGFKEVVTRGHEKETIEIELKLRIRITGVERLVTYFLSIGQESNQPVIFREILKYKRGPHGSPFHFLDFERGEGYAITNEEDFEKPDEELNRETQKLDTPDILAIKGLGQFERFKAANAFRQLIENWHISDFHISAAKGTKEDEDARHLSSSGDNLPAVARFLHESHPGLFAEIKKKMQDRVPGVSNIESTVTEDGRLLLRYQDGAFKDPFIDRNVSDGTIKMFAYLVLLHDPKPFPVLCVEEPENQLYPELLEELAEEFAAYAAKGGQVFISSHSPDFVNATELQNFFWLEKDAGVTRVCRGSDYPLLASLVKEGEKLGQLWKQGLIHSEKLKQ